MTEVALPRRSRSSGWWGVLLLVLTEASLFGTLVASYFYLRFRAVDWPPDDLGEPKVVKPGLVLLLLVVTSAPMAIASGAALTRDRRRVLAALSAALVLGLVYAAVQVELFREGWPQVHAGQTAYGSIFVTLAGAHFAHVAVGILLDAWLLLRITGGLSQYRANGVRAIAFYWHAVNVLAVVVYLTLVSPRL